MAHIRILLTLFFTASLTFAAEPALRRDATVNAVEKVMPCVVNIATATVVEYEDFYQRIFRDFFGQGRYAPRQEQEYSVGSGVIIDEDGYVLTNLHVVRRANRTQVKLWDGRVYDADRIVATEHSDVALLKIRGKPGDKFKAVNFAQDDDVLLGETVLALGNPFGLGGSVTKGILSSKSRRPPTGNEPLDVNDWLQTDAAINPGNSGGPLINLQGDLIGLNVAVYREGQGIGFAIPVKHVSEALASFFSPEIRNSLWFGARLKPGPSPLEVTAVQPHGPAQTAGLREGDRILQVNGKTPSGLIQFGDLLTNAPGDKVSLLIEQGREKRTIQVHLVPFIELIRQKTGLALVELDPARAGRLGLQAGKGLYLDEVENGSPAARAQLERGFLLTEIDGQPTNDLMIAGNILSSKKKGEKAHLTVVIPRRVGLNFVEYRQGVAELEVR